ncbi:MAG: DUF1330 domain-containing protein [Acidimicrobiales bacterium]
MPSIDPTPDQLEDFASRVDTVEGPIRMINLLRFREVADYGDLPDPGENGPSTGAEAYGRYGAIAIAEVAAVGGHQFEAGTAHMTLIGPDDEQWDLVAIIEYPSPAAFLEMIAKPSYQAGIHHRTAGLADTRLIMTTSLMR